VDLHLIWILAGGIGLHGLMMDLQSPPEHLVPTTESPIGG
jgi:hypothetical protein